MRASTLGGGGGVLWTREPQTPAATSVPAAPTAQLGSLASPGRPSGPAPPTRGALCAWVLSPRCWSRRRADRDPTVRTSSPSGIRGSPALGEVQGAPIRCTETHLRIAGLLYRVVVVRERNRTEPGTHPQTETAQTGWPCAKGTPAPFLVGRERRGQRTENPTAE